MINKNNVLSQIKTYLDITNSDYDSELNIYINDSIAIIENEINRQIVNESYELNATIFTGSNMLYAPLKYSPILSVTLNGDSTLGKIVSETAIYIPDNLVGTAIETTITYGYSEELIDIQTIIKNMVADFFFRKKSHGKDSESININGQNLTTKYDLKYFLKEDYKSVLNKYKSEGLNDIWL